MTLTSGQVQTFIALIGLIFAVMIATLGFVIRATSKWATVESGLLSLRGTLEAIVRQQGEAQAAMYTTMRDDRMATNERLLYLERKERRP
jgi:hypothetical protein